jgi:hypothetical protein
VPGLRPHPRARRPDGRHLPPPPPARVDPSPPPQDLIFVACLPRRPRSLLCCVAPRLQEMSADRRQGDQAPGEALYQPGHARSLGLCQHHRRRHALRKVYGPLGCVLRVACGAPRAIAKFLCCVGRPDSEDCHALEELDISFCERLTASSLEYLAAVPLLPLRSLRTRCPL